MRASLLRCILCCAALCCASHFDGGINGNNATLARRLPFSTERPKQKLTACAIPMCAAVVLRCAACKLLHRSESVTFPLTDYCTPEPGLKMRNKYKFTIESVSPFRTVRLSTFPFFPFLSARNWPLQSQCVPAFCQLKFEKEIQFSGKRRKKERAQHKSRAFFPVSPRLHSVSLCATCVRTDGKLADALR